MIRNFLKLLAIIGGIIICYSCDNGFFQIDNSMCRTIRDLECGMSRTILFYGTSLTSNGAWTQQLGLYFDRNYPGKVKTINSGGAGMNSRWGVQHLNDKVLAWNPDCIFIEFSINDAISMDTVESKINLKTIIDVILAELPSCEIILLTMNPRNGDSVFQKLQSSYIEIYRTVAQEHGFILADNNTYWVQLRSIDPVLYDLYIPDGVHPTAKGCEEIVTPTIMRTIGLSYK